MATYKLLIQDGWAIDLYKKNKYYHTEIDVDLSLHVANFPQDWQLIEEKHMTEKTIKLTLEKARSMYGKSPEMDELLLANFSKEELTKESLPKSWNELKNIQGYRLDENGNVVAADADCSHTCRRGRFAIEKQAKSALAMAQLSQLMAVYNDNWIPDFANYNNKYIIFGFAKLVKAGFSVSNHHFLAFKSPEIRDEFLANFEDLIKQYFMID